VSHATPASDRLGIYFDAPYDIARAPADARVSSAHPLVLFFCELGAQAGNLVLFGHARNARTPAAYVVPTDVTLVELPYYENLRRVGQVLRSGPGAIRAFWSGLERVDVVWVLGPHPFSLVLVALALLQRKQIVLGVRQETVAVARARLRGSRWRPALPLFLAMEGLYRLLGRRLPVTVQGRELAEQFGGQRVLTMTESVVSSRDVAPDVPERDWSGQVELLTVGRLDPEKNPVLLLEALARLEAQTPGRYRLTWVGRGPLEQAVRMRAGELGLEDTIDFRGYVPVNAGLLDLYKRAHIFVHVSLSEGMPKVLIEALACGTPVVATDVGGVRAALGEGEAGVLVPPDDLDALVGAIQQMTEDSALRRRVVSRGLQLAADLTLEAQAARVIEFIGRETNRFRD
jgi:glycosyltransferase involved in cell wall biosynthesis